MLIPYHFTIPCIPDATHFRYTLMATGGDVRQTIFDRSGQLLRMIGRHRPGEIACAIRGYFDPYQPKLQERLRWTLTLYMPDNGPTGRLETLVTGGPLGPFYSFSPAASPSINLDSFTDVCEVLRSEETLKPLVPRERNDRIIFRYYYALKKLTAREDNDFQMLDQAFSAVKEKAMIEILVEPADPIEVREEHFALLSTLMAVNAYDDDTFVPGQQEELPQGMGLRRELAGWRERKSRARDPLADEFLRENQELFQNLRKEQVRFSVKAFAASRETALTVGSALAESCFSDGLYQLIMYDRTSPWFAPSLQESLEGSLGNDPYNPQLFDNSEPPHGTMILRKMARMGTPEELAGLFRLPVAGGTSPRCTRKSTDPVEPDTAGTIMIGYDLETGEEPPETTTMFLDELLTETGSRVPPARLPLSLLKKHLFIAGASGSGKTTALLNLLAQLHRNGIPFLVIEPAKTEYRILKTLIDHKDDRIKELARDLRIYTPGNESISPFRINPLAFPDNVSRNEHISQLIACFKAGLSLDGPLEALIADALEEVYRRVPDGRTFPTMVELVEVVREIVESKGYAGEVQSNLTAAIEVRLGSLTKRAIGKVFSTETSSPTPEELLASPLATPPEKMAPTIIEMEYLGTEAACLLTLFILTSLRAHIRKRPSGSPLMHVIVLEEAHNIVGRPGASSGGGEDAADPKAHAAEFISRMLAELRALGEGIIIADQLPSAVSAEVVKNTGTKLAGRLVAQDDREYLGATMLLNGEQIQELARLRVGEAYLYHEDLHAPRRCKALNSHAYLDLEPRSYPVADAVIPLLQDDDWFQGVVKAQLTQLTAETEHFSSYLEDIADELLILGHRIKELVSEESEDSAEAVFERIELAISLLKRRNQIFFDECFDPVITWASNAADEDNYGIASQLHGVWTNNLTPRIQELNDGLMELKAKFVDG